VLKKHWLLVLSHTRDMQREHENDDAEEHENDDAGLLDSRV
jgi:hypothetical protein